MKIMQPEKYERFRDYFVTCHISIKMVYVNNQANITEIHKLILH